MQISTGARIASFEIRAPLGAGGMGAVYRAYDTKLGRDVAIKIVQENIADSPEYRRRFEGEARAASALNHPNIITIYEIDEVDGTPFIAMELVEGMRLRDLLSRGAIPVRKLLDLSAQIADGMAAAHARGIVHRDLKPENLMVTPQGAVKILDFGLARPSPGTDDESTAEITDRPHPRIAGTAAYMSPEQASGGSIDFRSDQFAFGAVLYEMATGRRAFRRDSAADTILAVIHDEPEPIRNISPNIPAPFCWIVERCLAKDPNDRYASTTDLLQELRTVRDRLTESVSGPAHANLSSRSRAASLGIVAVLAVAAAVGSRLMNATEGAPSQRSLAVFPFKDLSGQPERQLFSHGFADAVSSRLGRYSGIQVIPLTSTVPLLSQGATLQRVTQKLGATLVLNGTVQRAGNDIRVNYTIVDAAKNIEVAGDAVSGPLADIWAIQDDLADSVARDLGIVQRPAPTVGKGLETASEQDLYLRAIGRLDRYDDEKQIDSAIALLRELLETSSQSALVNAGLARAYLGKYSLTRDAQWIDKASGACARAAALDPRSADVLSMSAKLASYRSRYDEAIRMYKRSLALQPNSPEAVIGLAQTYAANGQLAAAEQQYRRGISLNPSWWYGHNQLGTFYFIQGRFDAALREYTEVTRLDPESWIGHVEVGNIWVTKGNLQKAADAYKKATSKGDDAMAYANLGYCYFYLGMYDKAVDYSRRAVKIRPAFAAYWANLGDACSPIEQYRNEARDAYAKGIELSMRDLSIDPNTAMAHAVLARCLSKSGKPSDAREHIRRALEIQPRNPTWMYEAARVANLGGNQAEALSWLQRALAAGYQQFEVERDPDFAKLRTTEAFRKVVQTSQ